MPIVLDTGAPPEERRRRRPPPSFAATRERPAPAPGLATYQLQAPLPPQLDPRDRQAATGESMLGWMVRRYGIASAAGLDPERMPINAIHDLATMPIDDRKLARMLQVIAPLQDDVTARLVGRYAAAREGGPYAP